MSPKEFLKQREINIKCIRPFIFCKMKFKVTYRPSSNSYILHTLNFVEKLYYALFAGEHQKLNDERHS